MINHEPLVSIIITCYNYGHFLKQAIDSALSQSYSKIEVVVLNDGSTDNSDTVAKSYGDVVNYISHKNMGLVATLNKGIKNSKGDYFCILSADDFLHKDYVRNLITPFLKEPSSDLAFVYCDYQMFGVVKDRFISRPWNYLAELYRNYVVASAIIKRTAFDRVGGFSMYMNGSYGFEDWDFWIKLIKHGYKGKYIPGLYYYYRIQKHSRNTEGSKRTYQLVRLIRKTHRKLYARIDVKIYLFIRGSLERIRNKIRTKVFNLKPTYPI